MIIVICRGCCAGDRTCHFVLISETYNWDISRILYGSIRKTLFRTNSKPRCPAFFLQRSDFLPYILQLYCPSKISTMGSSGCFSRGKPTATESRYPTKGACWVFKCFHKPPNSDMDYGTFNVHTDVNACNYARGCTDTVRESALQLADSGRQIPCRTGESNLRRRHAGPTL